MVQFQPASSSHTKHRAGRGGENTHDEYCGKVFITREINRECEESKQHARCIGWSWGCDVQGETEHQPK